MVWCWFHGVGPVDFWVLFPGPPSAGSPSAGKKPKFGASIVKHILEFYTSRTQSTIVDVSNSRRHFTILQFYNSAILELSDCRKILQTTPSPTVKYPVTRLESKKFGTFGSARRRKKKLAQYLMIQTHATSSPTLNWKQRANADLKQRTIVHAVEQPDEHSTRKRQRQSRARRLSSRPLKRRTIVHAVTVVLTDSRSSSLSPMPRAHQRMQNST